MLAREVGLITPAYDEPVKRQARHIVIKHAVEVLTTNRPSAAVVSPVDFDLALKQVFSNLKKYYKYPEPKLKRQFMEVISYWQEIHELRIGSKEPKELQVLILCGPNPLNDFEKLRDFGVPPFNVWAVEADSKTYEYATEILQAKYAPYRIHKGSLNEFLAVVPQQFDIVYFDGCGPVLGGRPSTLQVLRELFLNQRLSPLSVLITNFSSPNDHVEKINWVERLATWYGPRSSQPVYHDENSSDIRLHEYVSGDDHGEYLDHIERNFRDYYSHFATSFLYEFSGQLLPWWRATALKGSREEIFAPQGVRRKAVQSSTALGVGSTIEDVLEGTGLAALSPDSYRHLHSADLARRKLKHGDKSTLALYESEYHGTRLLDAANAFSLLRNFWPGTNSFGAHDWLVCDSSFRDILSKFVWMDSPGESFERMFCDTPFFGLLVDLCAGQIGYPYHMNLEHSLRLAYTAKSTEMFMDVSVLDQARYMYDFFPSIALLTKTIPIPIQIVVRICMDAIWKNSYQIDCDLFHACTLFQAYDHERLNKRRTL